MTSWLTRPEMRVLIRQIQRNDDELINLGLGFGMTQDLTEDEMQVLMDVLRVEHTVVQSLDVHLNRMSILAVVGIATMLHTNTSIRALLISGISSTDDKLILLLRTLRQLGREFESLSIYGGQHNPGAQNLNEIEEFIHAGTSLQDVGVGGIPVECLDVIFARPLPSIGHLNCRGCNTRLHMLKLLDMMSCLPNLTKMGVSPIDQMALETVTNQAVRLANLTDLEIVLNDHHFADGATSVHSFLQALPTMRCLEVLRLEMEDNDEDVEASVFTSLAAALERLPSIRSLHLSFYSCDSAAMVAFSQCFRLLEEFSLSIYNYEDNYWDGAMTRETMWIDSFGVSCDRLKVLDFVHCTITNEEIETLALVLPPNLERLNLDCNPEVSDDAFRSLLTGVREHGSLTRFDMSYQSYHDEKREEMFNEMMYWCKLRRTKAREFVQYAPLGFWSHVLAEKAAEFDIAFFLIREKNDVLIPQPFRG